MTTEQVKTFALIMFVGWALHVGVSSIIKLMALP